MPIRRILLSLMVVTALVAGVGLIWAGTHQPAPAAPMPAHEFGPGSVTPGAVPSGPVFDPATLADGHLAIPSLGIDVPLVPHGTVNGSLVIPEDVRRATLYAQGARPGAGQGVVLVAGHVDNRARGRGGLWALHQARPGAEVWLRWGGQVYRYRATSLHSVVKAALPESLFATTGPAELAVVTCGGPVERAADGSFHYRDNVVLTAVPVGG